MGVINITAFTNDNSQISAIKAVMKALKIKFEISKVQDKPYNPEFVEKIKRSEEQYKKGQFTRVKPEDLSQFIDNL